MRKKALLALEDGTLFYGHTYSNATMVCGEVVFNTSMTGYQEICSDPSYINQIVLFTTAHVGNVGANQYDNESDKTWLKGLIVREMAKKSSSWRSEEDFQTYLEKNNVPWIEGIDTRRLTRHLRNYGSKKGCIMLDNIDEDLAVKLAKNHTNTKDLDLSREAVKDSEFEWNKTTSYLPSSQNENKKTVYVYDFGVKSNILRMLAASDCNVHVIPNHLSIQKILNDQPDGVIISNGPGDPAALQDAIEQVRTLIYSGIPVLGVCLGCQLIALAAGGNTKKMKFGHHGANHPVYSFKKRKVYITSQNHNFVINEKTLPGDFVVTHVSLFDGSIQGIKSKKFPVSGFQGHPEGSPGPQDIVEVFDDFFTEVYQRHAARSLN
ncbi:MAG: glutamine-hydrolyzing carbamoyl-phosphate synthase small subunit [Chlamydiae bacterium]|nr:glutamine-hydrolyzing carbamoyl-phosphate synthase small subunit [Chlamydiota bacterium]